MLLHVRRHMAQVVLAGLISAGLLAGCTVTIPEPKVTVPAPTIPVDPSKSVDDQLKELEAGFKKLYCPVRTTPRADAIVDEAKRIWNGIADQAKKDGLPVPAFDPSEKMCQ